MTERHYGYRYDETDSGHAPDIAKRIRADIKVAVAEGLLPGAPVTYSVVSESFSGGQSINIKVRDWPDAWQDCDGTVPGSGHTWPDGSWAGKSCTNVWCKAREDRPGAEVHQVLTEDAQAARMTLQRIHGAYNHDGSDVQSDYWDVRYYGQVNFEDASSAEWRARETERKRARREAIDARPKRRVANVTRDGRVVHDAVEDAKGRLVFACSGRLASFSVWPAEGAELTCTRCLKANPGLRAETC